MDTIEYGSCTVRLSGDLNHTVDRAYLTAAEAEVLRFLHGDDSVVNVRLKGTIEATDREEMDRLEQVGYGPATLAKVYPGGAPRVTRTFKQAGVFVADAAPQADEPAAPAKRGRKAKAETVPAEPEAPVVEDDDQLGLELVGGKS